MYKQKKHFVFVDWMKVIGMYAIILGHFAPPRPSENGTLRHITVGRAAIATPPEPI